MNYDTALRLYTAKRIEEIDSADILIGIPCYNNEKTIAHVIQMVTHGLAKHYKIREVSSLSPMEAQQMIHGRRLGISKSNPGRRRSSPYTEAPEARARP